MNTDIVALLTKQILTFVRNNVADRLYLVIQDAQEDGTFDVDTITNELDKILSEIPKTSTPVPVSNGITSTPVARPPAKPRTPGSKAISADVKRDANGDPIVCECTVKKTGLPCAQYAKQQIGDKYACGMHARSLLSAQPDPNKAIKTTKTTSPKSGSTFHDIIGTQQTTTFSKFNIEDVEDINE